MSKNIITILYKDSFDHYLYEPIITPETYLNKQKPDFKINKSNQKIVNEIIRSLKNGIFPTQYFEPNYGLLIPVFKSVKYLEENIKAHILINEHKLNRIIFYQKIMKCKELQDNILVYVDEKHDMVVNDFSMLRKIIYMSYYKPDNRYILKPGKGAFFNTFYYNEAPLNIKDVFRLSKTLFNKTNHMLFMDTSKVKYYYLDSIKHQTHVYLSISKTLKNNARNIKRRLVSR